ncbi:MAG: hypothetical protein HY720_13045 [Planctomycetes bacterium]|nr:hypothetical protein [Planctomycetota bacterium]
MPTSAQEVGEFNIVLSQVKGGVDRKRASQDMSRTFAVEESSVRSAIDRAPIVLFDGVTREQVEEMKERLVHLSKLGLDFKITKKLANDIPRAGWHLDHHRDQPPAAPAPAAASTPVSPAASAPAPAPRLAIAPEIHLTCPHCNKAFVLNLQVAQALGAAAVTVSAPAGAPAVHGPQASWEAIPIAEDSANLFDSQMASAEMGASEIDALEADEMEGWEDVEERAPAAAPATKAAAADPLGADLDTGEVEALEEIEEIEEVDESASIEEIEEIDEPAGLDEIADINLESSLDTPAQEEPQGVPGDAGDELEEIEAFEDEPAPARTPAAKSSAPAADLEEELDLESDVGDLEEAMEGGRPGKVVTPTDALDDLAMSDVDELEDIEIDSQVLAAERAPEGKVASEKQAIEEIESELDRIEELELDSEIENLEKMEMEPASLDVEEVERIEAESVEEVESVDDFELESEVQDAEEVDDIDFESEAFAAEEAPAPGGKKPTAARPERRGATPDLKRRGATPDMDIEDVEPIEDLAADEIAEIEESSGLEEVSDIEDIEDIEEAPAPAPGKAKGKSAPPKRAVLERASATPDMDLEMDEFEEISAIEPSEDLEEISEVEDVEAVEDISDVEAVDEIGEIEDIQAVEEIGEIESVEDLGDIGDIDVGDDLGDLGDLEDLDAVEEPKAALKGKTRDKSPKNEENPDVETAAKELEPWTGRARDYVPTGKKQKRGQVKARVTEELDEEIVPVGDDAILEDDEAVLEDDEAVLEDDEAVLEEEEAVPEDEEEEEEEEEKPARVSLKKKGDARKGGGTPAPAKKGKEPQPARKPASETAKKKKAGSDPEIPLDKEGQYSVFLQKITSSQQKQAVVPILCELRGIDEDEAEELADRMIVPVVKGVSKEYADEILGQFKKIGVNGRAPKMAPGK